MKFRILCLLPLSLFFACSQQNIRIGTVGSGENETRENMNLNSKNFSAEQNLPIMKDHFGKSDNQDIYLFTLTNANGIQVKITNYGGIITSIIVPDKNGKMGDIVLGYDSLNQYITNSPYFGATVGRYANRISKGRFTIDGKQYTLAINNGNNSLHGGIKGFDKVVWNCGEKITDSTKSELDLSYLSKDGEEGYPGNLRVKALYKLDDHNRLTITYEAETDKATPVNLCNHTYFNLNEANENILGHFLTLYADQYTQVNSELIPTGALPKVKGTPMDFNNSVMIGAGIQKVAGGYDHNFVLTKKKKDGLEMAAQLFDPVSGRQLEILTTQPGIQFYSGNFLDGSVKGKSGKQYRQHFGLCLETQHYPDSPNQPSFPNTILRPGEKYTQTTVYCFSVIH